MRVERLSLASLLIRTMAAEQKLIEATGFVVHHDGKPFLVTARHILRGRHPQTNHILHESGATPTRVVIFHHDTELLGGRITKSEPLYDEEVNELWLDHPTRGGGVDLCALPLTNVEGVRLFAHDPFRPMPTLDGQPLGWRVAEPVNIIGFPLGFQRASATAIWAAGSVASEPSLDWDGLPAFLVNTPPRLGSFGAPVLLYWPPGLVRLEDGSTRPSARVLHHLLGVYAGSLGKDTGLGLVWRASLLQEILLGAHQRIETDGAEPAGDDAPAAAEQPMSD